jgi:hypothetical protein
MTRVFRLTREIAHRLVAIQAAVSRRAGVKVPMSTVVREVLRRGLEAAEVCSCTDEERGLRGPEP